RARREGSPGFLTRRVAHYGDPAAYQSLDIVREPPCPEYSSAVTVASPRNFAFIDGQNLHLGIRDLDWRVDWRRLRVHLEQHCRETRAFYFVGFIPDNQPPYTSLANAGYPVLIKPVTYRSDPNLKTNVAGA